MAYLGKRAFDIVLSGIGVVFAAPIVLLCAIAIRLNSPGPAIFRQARVGRDEAVFVCLKLRTMSVGTGNRPSHETSASSITTVGRFLRRSKLDELPQLLNVLVGDMSFVGPRPCLPSQTELIRLRREKGLYTIRPGITGVAQIRGIDMSDPERLAEADATYLDRMSLGMDLKVIWMTATGAGKGDAAATS